MARSSVREGKRSTNEISIFKIQQRLPQDWFRTQIIPKVLIACNCYKETAEPCSPKFLLVYFKRGKYKLTTFVFFLFGKGMWCYNKYSISSWLLAVKLYRYASKSYPMDTWLSNFRLCLMEGNTCIPLTLRKMHLWCWCFYSATLLWLKGAWVSLFGFILSRPKKSQTIKIFIGVSHCPGVLTCRLTKRNWKGTQPWLIHWWYWDVLPGCQHTLLFILLISTKWDTVPVSGQDHHWTHCDTHWSLSLWNTKGHFGIPQT